MAAIRIQLAGRNEASVIALEGERITIGRSSINILQLLHPALSFQHAELIYEGDHYHLHDLGSTNGVFVNGQQVTDYHLRETCQLAFGTLECEFLAEVPSDLNVPVEPLPLRLKVSATQAENADLKALLTRLQAEIESLQDTAASQAEASAFAVARDQHEKVLSERESLKATLSRAQADMTAVCTARDDLQRAYDQKKAELDARPTQSQLDSSLAENTQLKTRLETLAKDSEELTTLRGEHSALKDALGQLETEMLQVKAERNSSRRENSKLQATMEAQARELVSLQESHVSLSREVATRVPAEEHRNVVAEHASAMRAQERLHEEITQLRKEHEVDITALCTARDDLQRAFDQQKAELGARPTQSQLDSSLAENTQLRNRLEALAKDSEELSTLRGEHSALKDALGLLETEMLQVKAERNSSRRENSKLQATLEVQARELVSLQESHASLSREFTTRVPAEEHQKLAAEHASAKQAQERLQEEITRLEQDLTGLAADREALQNKVDTQRAELETLPKPAELDSLRVANAELEERAKELTKLAADQATSAKEAHERLHEEITQLRQNLADLAADRESLQNAVAAQRAELETLPKPAELDSLRATNAELEERAKALTALASDRDAAAKKAQERFEDEITRLKQNLADLAADRNALQKTIDAQRAELERMPTPAELDALRAANAELQERAQSLEKSVSGQASPNESRERHREEITQLKKNLADLTADREALRKTADAQRAELESLPKLSELDSLRAANGKLEERIQELTTEIAALSKTLSAFYVLRNEHEKLVAEHTAMKEAQLRREAELQQVNHRLAESLTQHANFARTLKAREDELETLRNRPDRSGPIPHLSSNLNEARTSAGHDRQSLSTIPPSGDMGLEEAFGELGFVIRPIKQQLTTPLGTEEDSSTSA